MAFDVVTVRKSSLEYDRDKRSRQIDELQRLSQQSRDDFLGANWYDEIKNFWELRDLGGQQLSFRPRVNIPQLQILSVNEATDLTDASPRVYLANRRTGKRDELRERAFQQQWKDAFVNYQLMYATLWAQLSGLGWIQIGYDEFANDGQGAIWVRYRTPDTVDVDPGAMSIEDWMYIVLNDRLYPEQIRYLWPETGRGIRAEQPSSKQLGDSTRVLKFPEGPMTAMGGFTTSDAMRGDGRVSIRYLFIHDATIELIHDQVGSQAASKVAQLYRKAYPNGRLIVDAGGHIVADGDNPTPRKLFPVVPIYGLPPLTNFSPPPPIRFSKDLQDLAGRMLTQTFENAVRLNNAIWFIDSATGIDPEAFGGLPGEVQVINNQSRLPEVRWPQAMPEHMIRLPMLLLSLQKELQGFTPSREGSPGAGNISADLFEASIFQSKRLTRCRARMLAYSVYHIAYLMYNMMAQHYTDPRIFAEVGDEFKIVQWHPADEEAKRLVVHLDETSLMPISQSALRQLAPQLMQVGAIDVKSLLDALEVPNAAEIAAKVDRDKMLTALARLRRR